MRYALALIAVLVLAYCTQPEKPAKPEAPATPAVPTPPPAPQLGSVDDIDAWFNTMQAGEASMKKTESTIARGDATHQLTTCTDENGEPAILKADIKGAKQPTVLEYYRHNGKVVLLRERLLGKSNTENRFYFADGQLLKALTRVVPGKMASDAIPFADYKSPYGDLDFRLKYAEVQQSAENYLQGK